MMKFPQTIRIYCPNCRKHTLHTVEIAKKRPRRKEAIGQKIYLKKMRGYGSFPREKPDYEKSTKKMDLRFKCTVCGKKHLHGEGWRVKKFQLVKK